MTQLPLPPLRSLRGPLPSTLVFSSVGDRGNSVTSWWGDGRHTHPYQVAIVYYGSDPQGEWACFLKSQANHFAVRAGGKFQNLLWWLDQHPGLLDQFEYVLVADDDIHMTPETISRVVRTARDFGLSIATPSREWNGKLPWPHMGRRGSGRRPGEHPGGVELTNFVEMVCPLFETAALQRFLEAFRPYADRLTGWGADWIMASACFSEARPFGILHNVSVVNPRVRSQHPECGGELDRLQPKRQREAAWLGVAPRFSMRHGSQIRTWLPHPRMRCINLERARERREQFARAWIEGLGYPVEFFTAFDRRCLEEGGEFYFPYDEAAARRRSQRPMTVGEIACATSHALLQREELEYCGPEGTMIFEDDCLPLAGAPHMIERLQRAERELGDVDVIVCHQQYGSPKPDRGDEGAVRPRHPPWGNCATWYRPAGLLRAFDLNSRMNTPADWIWQDFLRDGRFGVLRPAIATHGDSGTTYIGNQYRRVVRRFFP